MTDLYGHELRVGDRVAFGQNGRYPRAAEVGTGEITGFTPWDPTQYGRVHIRTDKGREIYRFDGMVLWLDHP